MVLISARFVFNPSEWHPHVLVGGWCAFRVSKNRPRCPVCAGQMKKNGTTSKGTTRWRCKDPNCGSSTTRTRTDLTQACDFKAFISYVTSTVTLSELAGQQRVSRWTLDRRLNRFGSSTSPTTVPRSASTSRSSSTPPRHCLALDQTRNCPRIHAASSQNRRAALRRHRRRTRRTHRD